MGELVGLLANLELCTGCLACEIACKQEHHLSEGINGIKVITLGPYEIDGELAMDFVPFTTDECDLCADRIEAGNRPFCVQICPTQALELSSDDEVLQLLRSRDRFHICNMKKRDRLQRNEKRTLPGEGQRATIIKRELAEQTLQLTNHGSQFGFL